MTSNQEEKIDIRSRPQHHPDIEVSRRGLYNYYYKYVNKKEIKFGQIDENMNNFN